MTKIVTATAALRLADEGRLDLDAPAADYVSYLRAPGPRQPTVRQLLTQTAGLANPLLIRWAHTAGADTPDPEAMLRRLMSRRRANGTPSVGPPGTPSSATWPPARSSPQPPGNPSRPTSGKRYSNRPG